MVTKKPFPFKAVKYGYLSPTKTPDYLGPLFRFKVFSSAKFNEKKYREDKEKLLNTTNPWIP